MVVVSAIRQQQPKDDVVGKELCADSFSNAQGFWKAETVSLVQIFGPPTKRVALLRILKSPSEYISNINNALGLDNATAAQVQ